VNRKQRDVPGLGGREEDESEGWKMNREDWAGLEEMNRTIFIRITRVKRA
jgi:hypothetical protein